ncbi:efflux RND transporter periplasmic adaptor subunit [Pseudalkalibacillus sp. SCS-8]|uniref:efflux RND transporter periplasmic adaptor subunit n=1 Tax=Pseudalkalibacillus nanhaiensis TaxID=3115291 RepID=UPI0032DBA8B1
MKVKIMFLSLLVLLTACSEDQITSENTTSNAIPVSTSEVKRTTFQNEIELVGKTVPSQQVPITTTIPTGVKKIHVANGDQIKAGTLLFSLDTRDLEQQLSQAQAAVRALEDARNQIYTANRQQKAAQTQAESVLDDTINELERLDLPEEVQDENRLQGIITSLEQLKELTGSGASLTATTLPLINSQLEQARKSVNEVKKAIQATQIKSPISGTIDRIQVKKGMPALPGSPLAIVSSDEEWKAVFQLNEFQIQEITESMEIVMEFDDIPGQFKSKIDELPKDPNETGSYTVAVPLDDIKETISADTVTTGRITIGRSKDALTISNEALLYEEDQVYVFLVKDGRAVKRNITIIQQGKKTSHIAEEDLSAGDLVVTEGKYQLTNRSKISIKK